MARKNNGIIRSPAEYALYAVIVLLLIILLVVIKMSSQDYQSKNRAAVPETDQVEGTLDEIGRLTDSDAMTEERLTDKYDSQEENAASADSAADDFGGVYDETQY